MNKYSLTRNFIKILLLFSLSSALVACLDDEEDLGTCTITGSRAPLVTENITFEACQEMFPNTVGANRMEWKPN